MGKHNVIDFNLELIRQMTNIDKMNLKMFFDESNNIRVVRLTENGTNENIHNIYFVLGGLAYPETSDVDLSDIFSYIGVSQIPNDAKLRFFTRGETEFKKILKETRLLKYLQFLKEKNIYFHSNVYHFLYYSLIDILDSLFEEDDVNRGVYYTYHLTFKSDFIEVLDFQYERVLSILYEFEYPNIPEEKTLEFIEKLLDLYTEVLNENFDDSVPENFTKELLRQMIKSKKNKSNLLFLNDNERFAISEGLFGIYLHNACLFNAENKIFDEEPSIKNKFENNDPNYELKLNMKFKKSHDEIGVQLSDVISGFMAKMINFISNKTTNQINEFVKELDSNSYNSLKLFFQILDYSNDYCKYFFVWQLPAYIMRKFSYFRELINLKI